MSAVQPAVQTLNWHDHALDLIDQRVLPQRFDIVRCTDAAETAAAIRDMVVRGAPAIGCAAAFGVAAEAWEHRDDGRQAFEVALAAAMEVLAQSRPTAINLFWAIEHMRKAVAATRSVSPREASEQIEQAAMNLFNADIAANRAMGAAGAALVRDGARIMTHCNAGALATAGHGTALGVIRSARDMGKKVSVIANETRPFLQGARLTAWEMLQEKIPVTLITDNMAGHMMREGRVDMVIVGADRIAANGDTANKIGTYSLAILAKHHDIPFYVAAPLSTFDTSIANGAAIPIEQRHADEVTGYAGTRWAPEGVEVANPAFDVTPAELISAIITEKGVMLRPSESAVRALFKNA
ncbi:MAG: S-methyl-5-thioribose-1-phosphate isomerase [Betaproteobacteria bacterium RIFCSPLOWO2_02_FULL_62_17]|nr:MAG: S-methyl-5-thioribose-1-phosphate isomerase [Betaproteobacteria bacterium RIFCSPLOWO2_02_FULL_62_17]